MSTNLPRNFAPESERSQLGEVAQELPLDDLDLWRRFKLGDEQAAAELYDRYSPLIYNVAHKVLRDHAPSEDVLQEVLFRLWRVPDSFDPSKGSLRTWLTVVSRRRAIDWLREHKAESDVADLDVFVDATQLAEAAFKQIANRVNELLADLPEKSRVTFQLAYTQGMTHTEISELLREPLGTTKSRIRKVLSLIRKRLGCKSSNSNGDGHV